MAQSKAEFVRSLPPTTPAKEVIAKAKEKGMKLSAAYVYVIRSKGTAKSKAGSKGGRKKGGGAERQFVDLALELGFSRAQQLLDDTRAAVQRAVR